MKNPEAAGTLPVSQIECHEDSRVSALRPLLATCLLVGFVVGGLLIGFEPVGGDPDRLYRPLKDLLRSALAERRLPFWSDGLGLGIPLLAESHAAALYPLNWALYSWLDTPVAYRLAMWLHYVALAAATFGYARRLGVSTAGSSLTAIAFTLCGFQAIHSSHEPFYHALPFLPLALLIGDWFVATGRRLALVLLAIAWGVQLTLGHFQIQFWTAALVVFLGVWQIGSDRRPWTRLLGLGIGLGWGAALAAVQLALSWELARFVGFTQRSFFELAFFGFPPAHLSELAIPTLWRGIPGGPEAAYFYAQGTSGYEACLYLGTLPLILAFCGLVRGRDRALGPWLPVTFASLALGVMPMAWPAAYAMVLKVPGLGFFRAPGRYTLIASLGICLAAGRGLDRRARPRTIQSGLALAWIFGLAAATWGVYWAIRPDHRAVLAGPRLYASLALAAISWTIATLMVLGWRRGKVGESALVLAATVELAGLYYTSSTDWARAIPLPSASRVLERLSTEANVGHVAGLVHDLPIRAGLSPIFPYTGFRPPPPHPVLEFATRPADAASPAGLNLLRRYGVTHGVWDVPVAPPGASTIFEGPDPTLDRIAFRAPGSPPRADWRIVRYQPPFPTARATTRVRMAPERNLISSMSLDLDAGTIWYAIGESPEPDGSPRATAARVTSWDGRTAEVEHDGSCHLVICRTFYPGWVASINGGPGLPVRRAEAGIQAVPLSGKGPSRVSFDYRPTNLWLASTISLTALALAGAVLVVELRGLWKDRSRTIVRDLAVP